MATKQEKKSPDDFPEIVGLRAMGSLMFGGMFEQQVQYSSLLRCYKHDPDPKKAHHVQECRDKDEMKMCPPCQTKHFLRCANQAFNRHMNQRFLIVSGNPEPEDFISRALIGLKPKT